MHWHSIQFLNSRLFATLTHVLAATLAHVLAATLATVLATLAAVLATTAHTLVIRIKQTRSRIHAAGPCCVGIVTG